MSIARIIHLAECAFLLLLAYLVVMRLAPNVPEHPQLVLFLTAELLGVVLILIQRRGNVADGMRPILLAFAGTGTALLVIPKGIQIAPDAISSVLVMSGVALSILAKLSLRRSFGLVAANRGVKSGGLYRLVRHPMYMAYMINHVGFLLLYLSAWNVAIYTVSWILLWMRAEEEEKVLGNDPAYQEYAARVRARLIPGVI